MRLPDRYGLYTMVYNRYNRWAKAGVWPPIFEKSKRALGLAQAARLVSALCIVVIGFLGDLVPLRPDLTTQKFAGSRIADCKTWLGREDSNLRMPESKSGALPLGYAPP